jgi:phosphate acetyltransferase
VSRSVYVASPEGLTGKSAVALGLLDALIREVGSVGVFRPLTTLGGSGPDEGVDHIVEMLVAQPGTDQTYEEALGVTYAQAHDDPVEALHVIIERYGRLASRFEVMVVLGSDYTDVSTGTELSFNARVAANLGSPVVLVVHGRDRTPEQVRVAADGALAELKANHAQTVAVIANRVEPDELDATSAALADLPHPVTAAIPENALLAAPSFRSLAEATGARLVLGSESWMDRDSLGLVVAAMSLPNVLSRLRTDVTVIAPGDRTDLVPGLMLAHQSGTFPALAGIILTGGYEMPETIARLTAGVQQDLPIALTEADTMHTAQAAMQVRGPMMASSRNKIETARRLFSERVDQATLLRAIDVSSSEVRTPLMFEFQLMERARSDRRHIVLPESEDDRILEAADVLLRRGVAELTLLGDETTVRARGSALGLDLDEAQVVSPQDPDLVERFAETYAAARSHKGMTLERARGVVTDISYFGTMMVHLGLADGMVSGAVNTTAHTIRPALEFIKTADGVRTVSSVFLMCLADRVLVYGDCAVIPDPTTEQLADIAISSAQTAAQFGIDPRVAMLSYSTGSSGSGAEVEKVRAATQLVAQRAPELRLAGPIQYDAAIDPVVGRAKMPDSDVAGKATVFVFPDLNTGNNTYKAVQRSAHAVAIGPVLQGLRKPVNDLSRGALVDDIVNTVAITAVQAQSLSASAEQGATG